MAVWHIAEPESFFLEQVPLQKQISHPHKRLQHLAGRLLLKELVPGFPVELIRIADTKKPYLENEPYHFSISHCGDYAAAIVSRLEARGHQAVAGVGPVRSGDGAAATSYADAALTAQAVRLLPELGTVAGSEDLGVYRWLLTLPRDELHPSRYPAPLRRLIEADPAGGLLETLATYLECGGDVGRASSALHVHRSTLYYRLGRIEELAGVDLHEGSHRLELHVGLKLRRLVEQL